MIYSAKVVQAGLITGQWVVTPQYTRYDGTIAADITALSADGIKPVAGDFVLCVESINSFDHGTSRIFDDNSGACPIIIAVFSQLLTTTDDVTITGKVTLGTGSKKMVLGNELQTWAQAKDAEIAALYTWAKTGVAPGPTGGIVPFPGTPAETNWNTATLSENHKLD
jgi:hypothetical protein